MDLDTSSRWCCRQKALAWDSAWLSNLFGQSDESEEARFEGCHPNWVTESESEMFLFDPYQKYIQSNNETILDQGTPIKTSLVANIRAAYYIINNYFFISQAKNI